MATQEHQGRAVNDSEEEESCADSEDCSSQFDNDEDPEEGERRHFLDVCWSLMEYPKDAAHEITRLQEAINELDDGDLALWSSQPDAWLREIQLRAESNSRFLQLLPVPEVCGAELGPHSERLVREPPDRHRVASRNSSKVRSTLRQFVRDWAKEGEAERAASYLPLVEALLHHMPPRTGPKHMVLCPGCGLGRLPFDLARCGYAAQGNEFSYHMLLGSHLILNRCTQAECYTIFPFAMSTTNRHSKNDHLRAVKIPDLCPRAALPAHAQLSMAAGEFIEVYKDNFGTWDAVATCFFLDTAKNVFLYIRTIAQMIRSGGIWTNLGPLLYHYADVYHEISIELSWEEVKPDILRYFDIIEEKIMVSQYAANQGSLTGVRYRCVFFVAVRNSVPPSGTSHPVF
mmetsp:Transcript_135941/g.378883  ORF Transcript_135941/g.378883 Transcript_135941/m.378883 type:complete len:401 (-) Transcript_135941:180-1382(-)